MFKICFRSWLYANCLSLKILRTVLLGSNNPELEQFRYPSRWTFLTSLFMHNISFHFSPAQMTRLGLLSFRWYSAQSTFFESISICTAERFPIFPLQRPPSTSFFLFTFKFLHQCFVLFNWSSIINAKGSISSIKDDFFILYVDLCEPPKFCSMSNITHLTWHRGLETPKERSSSEGVLLWEL